MTAPDIGTLHRADIRSLLEAWLLMLAGRAGTPGITSPQAAEVTGADYATIRCAFARLIDKRFIVRPSKDTSVGGCNRYCLSPQGLALLQSSGTTQAALSAMALLPLSMSA